ncbi:MAG: hypothetical protein WC460_06220 [Patescibacteria group bacterium]
MKKVEKEELFYCYYRNGDSKWHLYYEEGQLNLWQAELYPGGAIVSKLASEAAVVSMCKKPPRTLSKLEQKGITVHLRKFPKNRPEP